MIKHPRFLSLFCSALALLLLSACSHKEVILTCQNRACSPAMLLKRVQQQGVSVAHIGDDVHIVLQSDEMFFRGAANLNPKSFLVLDDLARLLKSYEKTAVKINAYTDNVNTPDHDLALSQKQGQAISSYLWRRGVDTRLLVVRGNGQSEPVATNKNPQGRAQNRRVEIDFRQLYS